MTLNVNSIKTLKSYTIRDFFPFFKGPWTKEEFDVQFSDNKIPFNLTYEYQGEKNEKTRYFQYIEPSVLRKMHALHLIAIPICHLLGGLFVQVLELIESVGSLFAQSKEESCVEKLKNIGKIPVKMALTPIAAICLQIISFVGIICPKQARGAFGAFEGLSYYKLGVKPMFANDFGMCDTGIRVREFQARLLPYNRTEQEWNLHWQVVPYQCKT